MLNQGKLTAGALAAASVLFGTGVMAADAKGSVYGDIRYGWSYFDDRGGVTGEDDLHDSYSYLGIKASTTRGGITAFGVYERGLDTDDSCNVAVAPGALTPTCFGGAGTGSSSTQLSTHKDDVRQAYAGLTTGLGTIAYGQMETAYSKMSRRFDPFYNTGVSGVLAPAGAPSLGGSHGGSIFSLPLFTLAYVNNQLTYTTPSIGGVSANVAYFTNEDSNATGTDDPDYAAGVDFSHSGIMAGVQHLRLRSTGASAAPNFLTAASLDATVLSVGYGQDRFGVGLMAEVIDLHSFPGDAETLQLAGWFGIMAGTRVAAAVGWNNELIEGSSVTVGVFHDVIENFTVHLAASKFDGKMVGATTIADAETVTLGASYKFDLGVMASSK